MMRLTLRSFPGQVSRVIMYKNIIKDWNYNLEVVSSDETFSLV